MKTFIRILICSVFFLSLTFIALGDTMAAKSELKAKPKATESRNSVKTSTDEKINQESRTTLSTGTNKDTKNGIIEIRNAGDQDAIIIQQLDNLSQQIDELKAKAAYNIDWQVLSSGGGSGSSTNYGLLSVVGQTAAGEGSSTNFIVVHGFVQNFGSSGCCTGSTGNVDGDGGVDIADLTFLIDHLFINFPDLLCDDEGNVDNDGGVDIADLTFLIDHLFINFP